MSLTRVFNFYFTIILRTKPRIPEFLKLNPDDVISEESKNLACQKLLCIAKAIQAEFGLDTLKKTKFGQTALMALNPFEVKK